MSASLASYMEPLARHFRGEPNARQSTPTKLRWGSKGSFSIDTEAGVWSDHEAGLGGGVLDFISIELRMDRQE
ncbi:MAG: hypothetical protein JWQ97_44, partial [Phenylobacterium sp.]|nr:hypothetical protein [Phenylobacterium sp.]